MKKRSPLPSRRQASLFAPPNVVEPLIASESRSAVVEVLADLLLEAAGRESEAKEHGDESEDHT
jgi:hypothetical protein